MLLILATFSIIKINYNLRENRCKVLNDIQQDYFNQLTPEPTEKMDIFNYKSCFTSSYFDLTPYYQIYKINNEK